MQWLLEKYVLKETLAKSGSGRKLLKISPKDVNIQKFADQVDIGSAAKLEIGEFKKKATYKKGKTCTFIKKLWFCMQLQLHILWKTLPSKSLFVQYAICFDPSYIVKNQDVSLR